MSKVTVAYENEEITRKYMRMTFVEFLEMVGRVAHLKFRDSELETLPLKAKIEYVLRDLFALPELADGLEESADGEDEMRVRDRGEN